MKTSWNPDKVICGLVLSLVWYSIGCGDSKQTAMPKRTQEKVAAELINQDDLRVLFIGNSHSLPIPELLTRIFKRQQPETTTVFKTAPSFGFLESHAESKPTLEMIRTGQWDFVVLQAQKYSTSGKYTYPTDGALKLSKIATDAGSKILMYPEWSREGVPEEYPRIKAIHHSIAEKTGAQVAPIGEAWELAASGPDKLYDPDGNHASQSGSYLNACVFYSMITGESPVRGVEDGSTEFPESYRQLEQAAWSAFESEQDTHAKDQDAFHDLGPID